MVRARVELDPEGVDVCCAKCGRVLARGSGDWNTTWGSADAPPGVPAEDWAVMSNEERERYSRTGERPVFNNPAQVYMENRWGLQQQGYSEAEIVRRLGPPPQPQPASPSPPPTPESAPEMVQAPTVTGTFWARHGDTVMTVGAVGAVGGLLYLVLTPQR